MNNLARQDIFNSFMLENAKFEGNYDIPLCENIVTNLPTKIITFEEARNEIKKKNPDYKAAVCFYKDDYKFDSNKNGIWKNPYQWLPLLCKFESVIQPDFSTYQDFPIIYKMYNTYRMRAVGHFLINNSIPVIANYRSGTKETFDFCTDGIPKDAIVCIGTHGNCRSYTDHQRIREGLEFLIENKRPHAVAIYGPAPKDVFGILTNEGIPYQRYETDLERRLVAINE